MTSPEGLGLPFSRRVTLALLASIVLLSLLVRFPEDMNARGNDTFFIAGFAESIATHGRLGWIAHPMSLLGLFPGSVSSGGPAIFASVAIVSGVPVGAGIVISDLVLAVLAALTGFMLGWSLSRNSWVALGIASAMALSPRVFVFTLASGSARSFTLVLFPMVLVLLVSSYRSSGRKGSLFALAVFLLFMLAVFHRSFILALVSLPVFAGAVASARLRVSPRFWRLRSGVYGVCLVALFVVSLTGFTTFFAPRSTNYATGELFSGDEFYVLAANMLIDYGTSLGATAVLAPFGLWYLLRSPSWDFSKRILAFGLLGYAWLLGSGQYTVLVFMPFAALLAIAGLRRLLGFRVYAARVAAASLALVTVATALSGAYMLQHWQAPLGDTVFVSADAVAASSYLDSSEPGAFFISNDWSSATYKVWSLSGNPGVSWDLAVPVAEGIISIEELQIRFRPGPLGLYVVGSGLLERTHWIDIMTNDPRSPLPQYVMELYDVRFFLYNKAYVDPPTTLVFVTAIQQTQYKVWDSAGFSIWNVPRT